MSISSYFPIGFAFVLAALLSWTQNKSIVWSMIHGMIGWVYIVYYIFAIWAIGKSK